jgi:hypothetical protein
MPLAIGVKYYCQKWLAARLTLTDNISFGNSRMRGMNNLSLTGGVEVRYGGPRLSYFPWNPAR